MSASSVVLVSLFPRERVGVTQVQMRTVAGAPGAYLPSRPERTLCFVLERGAFLAVGMDAGFLRGPFDFLSGAGAMAAVFLGQFRNDPLRLGE